VRGFVAGLPFGAFVLLPCFAIAGEGTGQGDYADLDPAKFQSEIDGRRTGLYTIKNKNGMVVRITNYGAKIEQILVPDRSGRLGDVALGYESIDQVRGGQASMGAFIGRYANRIAEGKFSLDGKPYQLAINNGRNTLHGGDKGSRFVVRSQAARPGFRRDELRVQGRRGKLPR
jgi:aldose 1-epimerase